jgi:DNA-binding SARP family transcriptional activator
MQPREAALAGPAKDTGQARWSLRLFGRFELSTVPGGDRTALPGKRERVLLAYLALSPNCRQQRRKLATLLWGNASDETALDNLRTCIWSLRKALGDTEHCAIASDGEDIVLDVSAFEVDAVAFRRLAAQPGRSELEEAANLYCGELLDGLDIENEEFES